MRTKQSSKAGERTLRERTYRVTILVEHQVIVKAYDEIGAEVEAIKDHKKWENSPVHQARVRARGFDTGFYRVPDAPTITKKAR